MTEQIRFDVGRLGNVERTPQGFLRIPGAITRTGVLTYVRSDGSEFRELRHPDDVFRADSLASLSFVPVTDRHPAGLVTPMNVKSLQVGIVTEARRDGRFVRSDLIIQDQGMIDKIERGEAKELSAGYRCKIDETPGVYQGERYDGRQTDIEYNHAALGPPGWGRAGSEVALHLDSAEPSPDVAPLLGVERLDGMVDCSQNDTGQVPEKELPVKIKIDGLEYDVEENVAAALAKSAADADTALQAAVSRADAAEGARDEALKAAEALQERLDAASDPASIAAAVKARVELEATAVKIGGAEMKLDGLSDHEVMVACIKVGDAEFDPDGKSEGYVTGRFDAIRCAAPARTDSRDSVRTALNGVVDVKSDSVDDIRSKAIKAAAELGRGPLN